VCVHPRARARACVCVWGWVGGCGCSSAGVCLRAFGLTRPVCHAQAPYCQRPPRLHHVFQYYLTNGTIFGKKSPNLKRMFWFSLQVLFETIPILRRIQRDIAINVKTSSL
jgi:hypothetical protein